MYGKTLRCTQCSRKVASRPITPAAPVSAPPPPIAARPKFTDSLTVNLIVGLFCAMVLALLWFSNQPKSAAPAIEQELPHPEPTPAERLNAATTLAEALTIAMPFMEDTADLPSRGTMLLTGWAMERLRMSDIMQLPATSRGLVMKDSARELGKRLCADGLIFEIKAKHVERGTYYRGGISSHGEVTRFIAVGDTGTLVEGNHARFCGIATAAYAYDNVAGGQTHAPLLVGMFDLQL